MLNENFYLLADTVKTKDIRRRIRRLRRVTARPSSRGRPAAGNFLGREKVK